MFEFVRRPPVVVADLAAALGVQPADLFAAELHSGMGSLAVFRQLGAADELSVDYDWDMYHEERVTTAENLAKRRLLSYTVWFPADRQECAAELRAAYGAPVLIAERHRYGPFYILDLDSDRFRLEWFDATPDWAFPPVDPAARVRAVEQVAARVALAPSQAELTTALENVPAGVGITVSETGLRFHPPMPAADVARALGVPTAIGRSTDVHMSSWALAGTDGERPRLGAWEADAELDNWPSGGDVPGMFGTARLGPDDIVRRIEFRPTTDP